jgi:hypothetical protein
MASSPSRAVGETARFSRKNTVSKRGSSSKRGTSSEKLSVKASVPDFSQYEKYGEDDDFYRKWSGPVLIGGFIPAIFALITIVSGQIILNSYTGSCGAALPSFISGEVATSYIYLLIFSWVYMGENMSINIPALGVNRVILAPFKSLKWVMGAYLGVGVLSFIFAIVGAIIMSLASFCQSTAPTLYTYSLFLLAVNWIGFFVIAVYLIRLFFGGRIATIIQQTTRTETMQEVESRLFKRKFEEVDTQKEGRVPRDMMNKILEGLGVFVPEDERDQLAKTLDPEDSGFIGYEVFLKWFNELSSEAEDRRGGEADDNDEDAQLFK